MADPAYSTRKKTILIIDDDQMVRHIARAIIEKLGYRVIEAENGEQAIRIIKAYDQTVDLAILDIVLPDIRGDELFGMIRQLRPSVKILLSSGYSLNKAIQDILDTGADGFIQKPYSYKSMETRLKDMLPE